MEQASTSPIKASESNTVAASAASRHFAVGRNRRKLLKRRRSQRELNQLSSHLASSNPSGSKKLRSAMKCKLELPSSRVTVEVAREHYALLAETIFRQGASQHERDRHSTH